MIDSHDKPQKPSNWLQFYFSLQYLYIIQQWEDETRKTYHLKCDYLGILSIKERVNYGSLKRELLDLEVKGLNWPEVFSTPLWCQRIFVEVRPVLQSLSFPFGPSVLEPHLYLCFTELKVWCQLFPFGAHHVVVLLEWCLKAKKLKWCESGSNAACPSACRLLASLMRRCATLCYKRTDKTTSGLVILKRHGYQWLFSSSTFSFMTCLSSQRDKKKHNAGW